MSDSTVSNWLNRLQQESWNLELLISGFSIFLLLQVGEPLTQLSDHFYELVETSWESGILAIFLSILKASSYVLIINLLVHVVTRGVWVGLVGLRSLGEIDEVDELNYNAKFSEYLKKRLISLDEWILQLDKFCSVIFAFSFLIVFMLLSMFIWLAIGSLITIFLMEQTLIEAEWFSWFSIVFILIFLLCSLIYLLDTLSLGFFKRHRIIGALYFPIYRFLTLFTLSFIYRGIYYHLVARLPRRMIQLILALYILTMCLYPFHTLNYHRFFPDNTTAFNLESSHYDDRLREGQLVQVATIPSKIIQTRLLPLFIRYHPKYNQAISELCTDYSPSKKQVFVSGIRIHSNGGIYVGSPTVPEESPEKLLNCLSGFYEIYLDTIALDQQQYYFDNHPSNMEKGLTTVIDLDSISSGAHLLQIYTKHLVADTIQKRNYAYIPFWVE